jgi:hypothetical protein
MPQAPCSCGRVSYERCLEKPEGGWLPVLAEKAAVDPLRGFFSQTAQ